MKIPPLLRELEGYIERDNVLLMLGKIEEIREILDELDFNIKSDMAKMFRGEV